MCRALQLTILLIVTFEVRAHANENPCYSGESEVLSCTVKHNKKLLSVCGSEDRKYVFYRFGRKSKPELEVEFSSSNRLVRWVDPRNRVTYFRFYRGGYAYKLGVPQETFGARAYYFVRKTGEVPDVNDPIFCTANSLGDKNWSSAAIRDLGSAIVED
jgi:hypothetical protein